MLARAADRLAGCVRGRAEALPFASRSFDLVFSVDVIHHVGDQAAFLREARRVLRSGGRLCTVTDSPDDIRRRAPLTSHFPETVAVELRRYPPIATQAAEMEAAGFDGIRQEHADLDYRLTDAAAYRARAFSSLYLIGEAAWRQGLARLEADLAAGPVAGRSLSTLLWGDAPAATSEPGRRSVGGTAEGPPR